MSTSLPLPFSKMKWDLFVLYCQIGGDQEVSHLFGCTKAPSLAFVSYPQHSSSLLLDQLTLRVAQ